MLLGARIRPGRRADAALALVFAGAWAGEAAVRDAGHPSQLAMDLPGVLLLACLVFRRRRPLLTTLVFAAGFCVSSLVGWALGIPSGDAVVPVLALMVVTYSLAVHARAGALFCGGPAVVLTVVVVDLTATGRTAYSLSGALAFFTVFVVGAPMAAGRLVRARSRLVSVLREQERRLVEQRAAATHAALAAERARVTARLHEALVSGMQLLVSEVAESSLVGAAGGRDRIAAIEARARGLLAQTREVVVALASEEAAGAAPTAAEPVPGRAVPVVRGTGEAGPWTSIAAAAVAAGLLLQVRELPVGVPMPVALLSCLVLALPLAVADRRPLLAVTVVWVAAAAFGRFVTPLPGLFAAIALAFLPAFLVAAFADRRRALAGLVICCAGVAVSFGPGTLLGDLPPLALSWVAGFVLHERGRLVAELRRTTALLVKGSEQALEDAVMAERTRIARDLHDSAGHRLTVLALHASAARRQWDSDPRRACAALRTIAQVADEALAELRQGFLPSDDGATDPPALSAVASLIEGARAVGLEVDLRLDGATAAMPPATQVTAYRVVQEALTNVLRHAPGASARVDVGCDAGAVVVVEVVNGATTRRRPAVSGADSAQGHGLPGMAQRVEACGGRLDWGGRPDGGYLVRAEFPPLAVTA